MAGVGIFLLLVFPVFIYRKTKKLVVFYTYGQHERYLQARELEYLMGVNNLYFDNNFHVICSFRRWY